LRVVAGAFGHVPTDHLLRSIDRFVKLSNIRRQLEPFYSAIGRSWVDPKLMIRMLLRHPFRATAV
jgi:transposase